MFYWLFKLEKKNKKLYKFCYWAILILVSGFVSIVLSVAINLVILGFWGGVMWLIILLILVGIICLIVCYRYTDSLFATLIYGIYIALIVITFSLFVLINQK